MSTLQGMESEVVDLVYPIPLSSARKYIALVRAIAPGSSLLTTFGPRRKSMLPFCLSVCVKCTELSQSMVPSFSIATETRFTWSCALLDEVFGPENFRSEIIWYYRRWSNSRRGLLPAHQIILYYTKTGDYTFNEILTEYSPATNVDQILQRRSRDGSNKSVYDRDENGKVVSNGAKRGVPLSDVWDIPFLNPKAKERTGYPTQKPLLLLERIIGLATKEGDWVLDPFCGSGTTLVAAQGLNRAALGIDISEDAVKLTRKRLEDPTRSQSRLLEIGREAYRNADDSVLAMLQGLECVPVQRNNGIDAILKQEFHDGPVTVRVQRPGESLLDAAQKLSIASADKGAKLMFVVVLARGGCFEFADELPPGVVAIESPALGIREHLEKLNTGHLAMTP